MAKLNTNPRLRRVVNGWLKAGVMDGEELFPTEAGTPQGGVISPVLMNLVLDGLEPLLKTHFPKRSGKLVNLTRFADDFIITGRSKEILENEVKPLVIVFLSERGLRLSEDKTRITYIFAGGSRG